MALFGRTKPLDDHLSHTGKGLARTLSWPHLIALGIGCTIGMGIFTLTGVGAKLAGPGVILSFALAGIVVIFAALAYTEMATLIPASGSAFTYTYSVLGEGLAWVVGWSLVLEYALGAAAVSTGWSGHIQGFLEGTLHFALPHYLSAGPMDGGVVNLFAVVIALVVTGLLLIGTRESAIVNIVLVVIKSAALVLFVVLALPAIKTGNYHPFMPYGFAAHDIGVDKYGVAAAAAIVFFAFYGFDAVSTASEEVKNPAKDLTIGIVGSMIACVLIYMLVSASAVGAIPFLQFAGSSEPLPEIMRLLNYPWAAALVGAAAVIALPSVVLVCIYGQSRILFVMARDGLIPQGFAKVNKRGIPAVMTITTGIFVAAVAGFVPLQKIAELANAGTLCAFSAVSLSMIVLRIQRPELPRIFKTPVFWLVGPAAIIGCLWLFTSLSGLAKLWFAEWNAIGLVFYFCYGFWRSRLRKAKMN
jgi:APA family basic amino acid/polyamine antiporter